LYEAKAVAQPADEHSWVERARAGDPEAAGWLYERYVERIHRYVYLKVGDSTEAEDITEQVFLKMLEAIDSFRWQGSSFASWLFRIAHNQVIDQARKRSRHPQVSLEPAGTLIPSEADDPYRLAEQSDFRRHLESCMTELTDLQAQVIQLKFWGGLSNAEVALIMDRTEGAIKALQFSALQNLKKLMSARGY
jgi:RNA polymerase sigma-70 factor (ECF subfamily)